MRYRIESLINDGKNEAPPFTVEVTKVGDVLDHAYDAMTNDYGEPFGVGATITITREA